MSFLSKLGVKPIKKSPAKKVSGLTKDQVEDVVKAMIAEAAGVDSDTIDLPEALASVAPLVKKLSEKGMTPEQVKAARERARIETERDEALAELAAMKSEAKRLKALAGAEGSLSGAGVVNERHAITLAIQDGRLKYDEATGAFIPLKDGKPTQESVGDALKDYVATQAPYLLGTVPGVKSAIRPGGPGRAPRVSTDPLEGLDLKTPEGRRAAMAALDAQDPTPLHELFSRPSTREDNLPVARETPAVRTHAAPGGSA